MLGETSATRVVANTVNVQNVSLKKCNCKKPQSEKNLSVGYWPQCSGLDFEVRYPSLAESSAISV